jgi:hypothetical protein
MELTLVLSFKPKGAIFSKPRVSSSKLRGDRELQERFGARGAHRLGAAETIPAIRAVIASRPAVRHFVASRRAEPARSTVPPRRNHSIPSRR